MMDVLIRPAAAPEGQPIKPATSFAMVVAAAIGSSAAVTARPITSRSAPDTIASAGVAARAWSWELVPDRRMPGTTVAMRGAY